MKYNDHNLTMEKRERVILVSILLPGQPQWEKLRSLDELTQLAKTAGCDVVERILQRLPAPNPRYFIGKGKAEQLAQYARTYDIDAFIFDDELTPAQVRNLENLTHRKVIDRTELILDIFAQHARTTTAKIEVELSQLKFRLARLDKRGVMLSRLGGGIGTRGPGEKQLEIDRRKIRNRIRYLESKLRAIEVSKAVQRKRRLTMFKVAIVGYANAGKSSLLNVLTRANVKVEDKLFSTLDPTTRVLAFSPFDKLVITDTVGFIRNLPHELIASFKSTLEEAIIADLRLHVVDISHPYVEDHIATGNEILELLGVADKPKLYVFNKIDKDRILVPVLKQKYPDAIFVSCLTGEGIPELKDRIRKLYERWKANLRPKVKEVQCL